MLYFWMTLVILTVAISFGMYEKTGESFYGYYLLFCATVGVAFEQYAGTLSGEAGCYVWLLERI